MSNFGTVSNNKCHPIGETKEDIDGRKMDAEDYDAAEGELSSTLLSDMTNLQPSESFKMISPIKAPPNSQNYHIIILTLGKLAVTGLNGG